MQLREKAEILSEALMKELTSLRIANGLSKNEAATRAGLAVSFVSNLESGKRRPGVETLAKLAWVYKSAPSEILACCEKTVDEALESLASDKKEKK